MSLEAGVGTCGSRGRPGAAPRRMGKAAGPLRAGTSFRPARLTPSSRTSPLYGVALAGIVVVAAIVLRGELTPAQNLNDGAMHWSMVRWAEGVLRTGRLPLDGWYPRLGLGFAQFHHYQSFSHVVTAVVSTMSGSNGTFPVMQWLLLVTLPVSAWLGARLF